MYHDSILSAPWLSITRREKGVCFVFVCLLLPPNCVNDEELRIPADRPADADRDTVNGAEPNREEIAAGTEEMGSFPWKKSVLLRWTHHVGQTERCPSADTGPYCCHLWPFLCIRVSIHVCIGLPLCLASLAVVDNDSSRNRFLWWFLSHYLVYTILWMVIKLWIGVFYQSRHHSVFNLTTFQMYLVYVEVETRCIPFIILILSV